MPENNFQDLNERWTVIEDYCNNERVRCEAQLDWFRKELDARNEIIEKLRKELEAGVQKEEGHRQMINKLIMDVGLYQNEIEYLKRSKGSESHWNIFKPKVNKAQ